MEEKILVDSKEVELEEVKGKTKRIKEKIKKLIKNGRIKIYPHFE